MRIAFALALLALPFLAEPLWAQNYSGSNTGAYTGAASSMPGGNYSSGGANANSTTTSNFDSSAFQGRINSGLQRGQEYLRSNRLSTSNTGAPSNTVNGSFVGADLGDMRDFLGATKPGQARTRLNNSISGRSSTLGGTRRAGNSMRRTSTPGGSSNSLTNGAPSNGSGGAATGDSPRAVLRPEIEPLATAAVSNAQLTARLQQAQRRVPNSSLSVEVEDGIATLRGTVSNAHECALCQQLLALEPGVQQVKNLLTVAPAATAQPQP